MDEDDGATPPDGSGGGGQKVPNHAALHKRFLIQRLTSINREINRLEDLPNNNTPLIVQEIQRLYNMRNNVINEIDRGFGWERIDNEVFDFGATQPTGGNPNPPTG